MKRARFTEEQIIGILAEHEAGAKCADLCRKHGISALLPENWTTFSWSLRCLIPRHDSPPRLRHPPRRHHARPAHADSAGC